MIKNINEYEKALAEVSLLWNAPEGSSSHERLSKLIDMIMEYEDIICPELNRKENINGTKVP
jgi:hypothetical protein